TLTSLRPSSSSVAAAIPRATSPLTAFLASGRLIVITAMPSATSVWTTSDMCASKSRSLQRLPGTVQKGSAYRPALADQRQRLGSDDLAHRHDAISCAGTSLCMAVDQRGNVITSAKPTAAPSVWQVANIDGSTPVNHLSCPNASFCLGFDTNGNVVF